MDKFWCKYCGKEKEWKDRNYEAGYKLAEIASYEALGHIKYVSPYLICNDCAKEIEESEGEDNGQYLQRIGI